MTGAGGFEMNKAKKSEQERLLAEQVQEYAKQSEDYYKKMKRLRR